MKTRHLKSSWDPNEPFLVDKKLSLTAAIFDIFVWNSLILQNVTWNRLIAAPFGLDAGHCSWIFLLVTIIQLGKTISLHSDLTPSHSDTPPGGEAGVGITPSPFSWTPDYIFTDEHHHLQWHASLSPFISSHLKPKWKMDLQPHKVWCISCISSLLAAFSQSFQRCSVLAGPFLSASDHLKLNCPEAAAGDPWCSAFLPDSLDKFRSWSLSALLYETSLIFPLCCLHANSISLPVCFHPEGHTLLSLKTN